jgi:hypothetical protein
MLLRDVATAKNFDPVADIAVGIPTPFVSGFSNRLVTFFKTVNDMLLIYRRGGTSISFNLLYLAIFFIFFYIIGATESAF